LLILLLLPANRLAQAWWVLAPVAAVCALGVLVRPVFSSAPTELLDQLGLAFTSLAFGLAALWLLAKHLGDLSRVAVFFLALVIMGAGALIAYAFQNDWEGTDPASMVLVLLPAIGALVVSLALTLSALMCRRTYRPFRLLVWLSLFILAGWLVAAAPIWIPMMVFSVVSGNEIEFAAPLIFAALLAVITLVVVLPFLLLAFVEPHYRDRLTALLRLPRNPTEAQRPEPPPLPCPPPAAP